MNSLLLGQLQHDGETVVVRKPRANCRELLHKGYFQVVLGLLRLRTYTAEQQNLGSANGTGAKNDFAPSLHVKSCGVFWSLGRLDVDAADQPRRAVDLQARDDGTGA